MVIKKEIIKQLSKRLSLPYTGTEQDWDIEMADATRINFFLHYFCNNKLSEEERFALMSLIIASYDDYLNEYEINADEIWNTIKTILEKERSLYSEIINYWA
ncbi:MAG: hypothetical protein LBT43_20185, partial [Prevotella sp.]|nr:hypothetical protein [Prevotella sp.]